MSSNKKAAGQDTQAAWTDNQHPYRSTRLGGESRAAALVSRLDRVRHVGDGRWIARCPAHDDRTPSLSIRELPDARVLIHDFSGCAVERVLAALGLDWDALYPTAPIEHAPRVRRPWSMAQGLAVLDAETTLIAIGALNTSNGHALTGADRERVLLARERIGHVIRGLHDAA
jgi:hypothetical protein